MEYDFYQSIHSSWTTPLDRLPQSTFNSRLQAALASDGVISSGYRTITITGLLDHTCDVACTIEITRGGELETAGHISWRWRPCDQCGQLHARRVLISGTMKCTDCVAANERKASAKSSADYRTRNRQPKQPVTCSHCGKSFMPQRSTATFCTAKCRVAAHRAKP